MMRGLRAVIPGLAVCSLLSAEQAKGPAVPKQSAPKAQAVRPPAVQNRPAQQAPNAGGRGAQQLAPGETQLDRLLKMTPQQREAAFRNLPPERREKLQQRLNELSKLPAPVQVRWKTRLELLNSLPEQRRNQVRRSINQFKDFPEDRRQLMNEELQKMAPLPDEERRAYMNSEEFRNKYSATEQRIIGHLSEIQP